MNLQVYSVLLFHPLLQVLLLEDIQTAQKLFNYCGKDPTEKDNTPNVYDCPRFSPPTKQRVMGALNVIQSSP